MSDRSLTTPDSGRGVSNRPRSASTNRHTPLVSVLVPTLEEARELPHLLDHVAALPGRWETIVADGGSRDATRRIAEDHPLRPRVVEHTGGRAAQLNAAADTATGDILLFLHADSRLPRDAYASLADAWARTPHVQGGNFALRFGDDERRGGFERLLGAIYRLQRRHGLYYGDSSVWVRRAAFTALGGFREIPIMDDYDFVHRLERSGATRCLPGPATTSARRWRSAGIARTVLMWFLIRRLYVAGVSPERLTRLYRVVR
ncbi:MAG: TIGR04283 family arsenosugar biosynthesis glycosyltransferase [Actinomycetota bacterium]|nr:TIGR04283 family arsenosugar biosynthesis glycosyltransferase [Actinomycetota bacterium]